MNISEEKLCLKWNDFQENVSSAFGERKKDMEFADVTLACEDGQQVEAHKVILASASPFFLDLLRRNKHPHPLIYMRGIKSEELMEVIDFLYYGEVSVCQESLGSFLALAQELKLKGIDENQTTEKLPTAPSYLNEQLAEEDIKHEQTGLTTINETNNDSTEESVAKTDYTVDTDMKDLEKQISLMIETDGIILPDSGRMVRRCKVCGKQGTNSIIRTHIESNHISGVSHTCTFCEKISRSRDGLRKHIFRDHPESKKEALAEFRLKALADKEQTKEQMKIEVTDMVDLDDKIDSLIAIGDTILAGQKRARICKLCGKQGPSVDIKKHIEARHITGVSNICTICGKNTSSRHILKRHNLREHPGTVLGTVESEDTESELHS